MTGKMPPIEKTEYPSLDMGHSFSRTEISIVGLNIQVYGLEEIRGSKKPIIGLVSPSFVITILLFCHVISYHSLTQCPVSSV